jgi:hypothetical protein
MPNYNAYQLSNSQQIPQYVGSIGNELISVAGKLQERYDTSLQNQSLLQRAVRNSVSLPQDKQMLNDLTSKYEARINERAKSGNYEDMWRDTAMDVQDFMDQYRPIAQNQQYYLEYKKKLDDAVAKGDIRQEKADKLLKASMMNYKGLTRGENGGVSNYFNGMNPVKDIDLPGKVDKYMEHLAPTVIGHKVHNTNGQWMYVDGSEEKVVSPEQISRVMQAAMSIDPELKGWLDQEADLNTLGYENVNTDMVNNPAMVKMIGDAALSQGITFGEAYKNMAKASIKTIMSIR